MNLAIQEQEPGSGSGFFADELDLSRLKLQGDTAYFADDDGQIVASYQQVGGMTEAEARAWARGLVQGYDQGFASSQAIQRIKAAVEHPTNSDSVCVPVSLVKFIGCHTHAIFLATCIRKAKDAQAVGCDSFNMTFKDWERTCQLTREQVDGARSLLEPHGVIKTSIWVNRNDRATNYKVDFDQLELLLAEHTKTGKPLPRLVSVKEWRNPRG